MNVSISFNPLNAELNPICHLLALLGAHRIHHISRVRVKISSAERACASYAYAIFFTLYKIFLENNLKFVV